MGIIDWLKNAVEEYRDQGLENEKGAGVVSDNSDD